MPTGRPLSLNPTKSAELCALVASGISLAQAARHVGCSLKTVRRHQQRSVEFRRQLQAAITAAPTDPLRMVREAAGSHWRAAAWLLERTSPERYAARPKNTCRAEQAEDLVARLIETALAAVPTSHDELATRLYKRLTHVAEENLNRLFPAGRSKHRSSVHTPLTDTQRLFDELQRDDPLGDTLIRRAATAAPAPPRAFSQPRPNLASSRAATSKPPQPIPAAAKKPNPYVPQIIKQFARIIAASIPPEAQNAAVESPKTDPQTHPLNPRQ